LDRPKDWELQRREARILQPEGADGLRAQRGRNSGTECLAKRPREPLAGELRAERTLGRTPPIISP
jgi:hypothetical protein